MCLCLCVCRCVNTNKCVYVFIYLRAEVMATLSTFIRLKVTDPGGNLLSHCLQNLYSSMNNIISVVECPLNPPVTSSPSSTKCRFTGWQPVKGMALPEAMSDDCTYHFRF